MKMNLPVNCFLTAFVFIAAFSMAQDSPVRIIIDANDMAQTIQNIGASGCWFSEGIGKFWPGKKKERIAELLFSKAFDNGGNPKGIGLSAWRFNIGAGTAEQGDISGIKDFRKRVECFLNADDTYNWNKQKGYQWFLKQAKQYGVETLIAFANSAPVKFTKNGLGYKTEKDFTANLKPEKYIAYVNFLTQVVKHFDKEGLHFDYISPVNEPQWDWSKKYMEADQEGSPWSNENIYNVVSKLDVSLTDQKISTKILLPEAGMLHYLYGGTSGSSQQIQQFFSHESKLFMGNLAHVPALAAGHSYFTDANDSNMIAIRRQLADTANKYKVDYWQSEYCMLADGFMEGTKKNRSAMDCALFLAKVIHHDLVMGNATAWQYWNAYEPGKADSNTRYYLIALQPNEKFTDGTFTPTKNLWALGHYSLFVRPGMHRLNITRADKTDEIEDAKNLMISAYANDKGKLVIVAINYSLKEQPLQLNNEILKKRNSCKKYVTTALKNENLKIYTQEINKPVTLPARSITTIVYE